MKIVKDNVENEVNRLDIFQEYVISAIDNKKNGNSFFDRFLKVVHSGFNQIKLNEEEKKCLFELFLEAAEDTSDKEHELVSSFEANLFSKLRASTEVKSLFPNAHLFQQRPLS